MQRRSDLLATGVDDRSLARMVSDSALERVRRGVYAPPPFDRSAELQHRRLIDATVPWLEPGAVEGFESAAVMHGLPVDRRRLDRVHILRPGERGNKRGRVLVLHRRRDTRSVAVDGIAVTSLVTTAVDCARTMPFRDGVAVVDAALRAGADRAEMETLIRAQRARGNPVARQVVAFADPRSESPGESHSRAVMRACGIPIPSLQVWVRDRGGRFRLDFAWEDERIAGEFDGRSKYQTQVSEGRDPVDVLEEERRRQQRIEALGWVVMRWGWQDLTQPGELLRRFADARARAGR